VTAASRRRHCQARPAGTSATPPLPPRLPSAAARRKQLLAHNVWLQLHYWRLPGALPAPCIWRAALFHEQSDRGAGGGAQCTAGSTHRWVLRRECDKAWCVQPGKCACDLTRLPFSREVEHKAGQQASLNTSPCPSTNSHKPQLAFNLVAPVRRLRQNSVPALLSACMASAGEATHRGWAGSRAERDKSGAGRRRCRVRRSAGLRWRQGSGVARTCSLWPAGVCGVAALSAAQGLWSRVLVIPSAN
jgi:hypothetical protein